jgi:glutamine transport system substrate-binding protein
MSDEPATDQVVQERNHRVGTIAVLILVAVAVVAGCGGSERVVRYAFDEDFPPHTFVREGTPQGFDIDVLRAVAADQGFQAELLPMQWGDAQDELASGAVDMVSGAAKTPEREERFVFAASPLLDFRVMLFVREGDSAVSVVEIAPGRLVTQRGSLYERILREAGEDPELYETEGEALAAVAAGDADGFVGADTAAGYLMRERGIRGVREVGEPLWSSPLYFMVRDEDPELVAMIDRGMANIVSDGTYRQIVEKWFGEGSSLPS